MHNHNHMFVYLLVSTDGCTYVGATTDLNRRLRQHNKELTGGARATGRKVNSGQTWERVCYVSGFPDWISTLQFEWRWKQLSRKLSKGLNPVHRRMHALHQLIHLPQSTKKSIPFHLWETMPQIHFELDDAMTYYEMITLNELADAVLEPVPEHGSVPE